MDPIVAMDRRVAMDHARKRGQTFTSIGKRFGVSGCRVAQIVRQYHHSKLSGMHNSILRLVAQMHRLDRENLP